MGHYKELEKIERKESYGSYETIIAEDYNERMYLHSYANKYIRDSGDRKKDRELKVKKDSYGAGVSISIIKFGDKRSTELSMELGRAEIIMLKKFFELIDGDLKNFTGEFVPTILVDLTK